MANALTPDPSHRPEDVLMEEAFGTVRGVAREDLLERGPPTHGSGWFHVFCATGGSNERSFLVPYTI